MTPTAITGATAPSTVFSAAVVVAVPTPVRQTEMSPGPGSIPATTRPTTEITSFPTMTAVANPAAVPVCASVMRGPSPYRPDKTNDINLPRTSSASYHCSTAVVVGVAFEE